MLHAFTHIYQVALMPLYLPIVADLKLAGEGQATLLVTVMLVAYFGPAYPVGALADKFSRKKLLGLGLLINALGFIGLAFAPSYPIALACVALSGFGGSFFHPAATSLVAKLYPVGTGRALGLLGVGASFGFFVGPLYSGWRAEMTCNWRAPVLELGVLGVVMAAVFAWMASETKPGSDTTAPANGPSPSVKLFPNTTVLVVFMAAAFAFGVRDFAGHGMASLGSLFLQKAHGFSVKEVGAALGGMYLLSAFSNPFFGHLSDRGRIRWTCAVLIVAAVIIGIYPHLPRGGLVPAFLVYGFFLMASYPMVEAALMVSVPDAVRGRVFGFFITIGGMVGNLSHALAGRWVQSLGERAHETHSYFNVYAGLAGLMLFSLLGLVCLHALRLVEMTLPGGTTSAATVTRSSAIP
ncbi:MAG: MFS transporter [Verrucomicrobia bacterium]|nr:MFS transporter [Verrucomicrobiota bacterium]